MLDVSGRFFVCVLHVSVVGKENFKNICEIQDLDMVICCVHDHALIVITSLKHVMT